MYSAGAGGKALYACHILLATIVLTVSSFVLPYGLKAKAAGEPDLIIESVTWIPQSPSKSDTVTITAIVKNQGEGKATAAPLNVYIDGAFLESQIVSSLNAGESATKNFTWLAAQGSHAFRLIIDEYNEINESVESNNEKSITISTLTPDLFVQSVVWSPADPYAGDNVTFTVAVGNQGEGRAINPLVSFRVDGRQLDAESPGSVDASSAVSANFTWTAEANTHVIELIVDPNNSIIESNENNNREIADFPTLLPDLIVESIDWSPEEVTVGDKVTFSITVKNQGRAAADSSVFSYYVGGLTSGTQRVSSILADDSEVATFTWTALAGPLPVRIVLDSENRITESNENNNETTGNFSGTKVPDLVIQSITWSPAKPPVGDTITISVTIKNTGNGRADSSHVAWYIDDTQLNNEELDPLEPDETQIKAFEWTVEEGTHTFKAVADSYRIIPESNEDNNEKTAAYPVPADLIIKDILLSPEEPVEGDNVTFTVTIENLGVSSAADFGIGYYIDEIYLGFADVGAIDSGATANGTFTWTATTGRHTLKAVVDFLNKVTEINENNNEIVRLFSVPELSVTVTPPVSSPTTSPTAGGNQPPKQPSAPPGVVIPNAGGGAAKNSMLLYYLLGLGGLIAVAAIFFEVWRRQE